MGLARFFHDEEDILTKKYDENVLGTADYLAPEQALDSHSVDIRADIYSLGATFYFSLTGRTPFAEGTVAQKLIWHQTRQPKAIRSFRPDVPEELVAVIEKMMAKDPAQRYQTPYAVFTALEPWTQSQIPPPPENEMPQLSLAAMGTAPGEQNFTTGARNPSSGAVSPPPTSRKQWQVGNTPTGTSVPVITAPAPPAPVRSAAVAGPTATPAAPKVKVPEVRPAPLKPSRSASPGVKRPAPPIVVPRKPATPPATAPQEKADSEKGRWRRVAPETTVAGVRDNTPPTTPRSSQSIPRPSGDALPSWPKDGRLVWWLIGGVTILVLVIALLIWMLSGG